MGNQNKNDANKQIVKEQDRSLGESNSGIGSTNTRVGDLTGRADTERGNILSGYGNMAATGGVTDADRARFSGGSGGSGGGGGGASGSGNNGPAYLNVYRSMLDPASGGIDPTRLGNINTASGMLRDTSGNYGDVNRSISSLQDSKNQYGATDTSVGGLQKFASTGGMNPGDLEGIDRQSLLDLESTGGYTSGQKGDIRARSNSGVASTYANLKGGLDRNKRVAGNIGPGWSESGLKLARQGAQDLGTNARNTEVDINERVNANKMAAGGKLSDANLQLQGLKNQATLSGYGTSGNLANTKQSQIDAANTSAGGLGLSRQSQIDAATAQAAGIDLGTAGQISQNQLAGAGGLQTEDLTRASIGASSGAAAAARNDANERYLLSERNSNQLAGNAGLLSTYGTAPSELMADQNLLRGYRQDASGQQQGLIDQRVNVGNMPGVMDRISQMGQTASNIAGAASGAMGAFGGIRKPGQPSIPGYSPRPRI